MASFQEETGGDSNGETERGDFSSMFTRQEDMTGIVRNLNELSTTGSLFTANAESDLYFDYDEEVEYDEDEVVGLAPLPLLTNTLPRIDLHEPPAYGTVEETMINVTEDGGVKKLVLKKGTGKMLPLGCKVWFHYVSFVNKDKTFNDSTISRKTTQSCKLEEYSDLVKGLDLAIKSMQMREVAQFMVKPEYAYGHLGCPPRIPAGATVFYNIQILNLITEQQMKTIPFMTPEERASAPFDDVYKASLEKRRVGNFNYGTNNYHYAVKEYRRGINYLEDYSNVTPEQNLQRNELLGTMFTNIAQSYLKLNKYPQACNACKNALRCNVPDHHYKIFYRFAQAKYHLGSPGEALDLVRKSLRCTKNPTKDVVDFEKMVLDYMKDKAEVEKNATKELYKKMSAGVAGAVGADAHDKLEVKK